MHVVSENRRPIGILHVHGDVDVDTCHFLERAIRDHLAGGDNCIIIDLSACRYIDSTGFECLLQAQRRLLEKGAGISLIAVDRLILRLLRITGLDRVFSTYSRLEDALRDLSDD